jgi:hypothetical protein
MWRPESEAANHGHLPILHDLGVTAKTPALERRNGLGLDGLLWLPPTVLVPRHSPRPTSPLEVETHRASGGLLEPAEELPNPFEDESDAVLHRYPDDDMHRATFDPVWRRATSFSACSP